jgi:hypothetical protein
VSAVVAHLISFSPLDSLRKVMARATNAEQDSTVAVLNILNQSGGPSTKTPNKRKRTTHPVPGPVGRPRKRTKISDEGNAATSGAIIMPASAVAENLQDTGQTSELSSTTKLRNPKSSASARPRGSKSTAADTDMYAVPNSPNSASPAINRRASGKGIEFSLEHSAFDSLLSSKKGAENVAKPPSQRTRSKSKNNAAERQNSPSRSGGGVRAMRKLHPQPAVGDSIRDDQLEVADERIQPSRASKRLQQRTLDPGPLAREGSTNEIDNLGCPSLLTTSRTRDKLTNVAHQSTRAPATRRRVVSRKPQTSLRNTGDYQSDDGEEDEDFEAPEDRMEELGTGRDKKASPDREAGMGEETVEKDCQPEPRSGDLQAIDTEERGCSARTQVTDGQQPDPPRRQGRFERAAELYDCGDHWARVWDAAKENQDRSDPETRTVRELVEAMQEFKDGLRRTANVIPDDEGEEEEGSMRELDESELDKIATAIGNLKKDPSRTGENEERLRRDIYFHAIPRAVKLVRSILIVRFTHGGLTMAALEELITVLKAARRLCERVYHWKPTLHLANLVKSRTNLDIKLSLKPIEDAYKGALSDLRAAKHHAKAKIREKVFAERQTRLWKTHEQAIIDNRQKMADWARKHDMAGRQGREMMRSRQRARDSHASSQSDQEAYDVDDLDSPGSTPLTSNGFAREGTEEIPGPTKRIWHKEETFALLLLLQKYRGPDRYERIQETISEIARDFRKLGPDKFLRMTDSEVFTIDLGSVGDVLDDLGNMEVADIQQQAKYLKASHARKIDDDIQATGESEKWTWLSSV